MSNSLMMLNYHHKLGLESMTTIPDEEKIDKDKRLNESLKAKLKKLRERPFWYHEVTLESYIPKNRTLELADVIAEIGAGLESWTGALKRLGVDNVEKKKEEILKDKESYEEALPKAEKVEDDPTDPANPGEGVKNGESPSQVEARSGQSAERTFQQRNLKGKPGSV